MKINYDKLKTQTNNPQQRCYLICGDEPLLVSEARQWLIHQSKTDSTEHIHFYPKETPWQQLPAICNNGSLLATHQLIDIRLDSSKLKVDATKLLTECINQLPTSTTVLLSCPRLESKTQNTTWVKAFDAHGIIIQVWPLSQKQIPYWLRQRVQHYQLRLTSAASQLIVEYCEGNLFAAEQTLQKLTLITAKQPLDVQHIQQVLTDSSHYDVFAWVDACLAGDNIRQTKIFQQLQSANIEPTLILWSVAKEIRLLFDLQNQMDTDTSITQLLKSKRILAKKQPFYNQLLQTMTLSFWGQLLVAVAATDRNIKGITKGNQWDALQQIGNALATRDTRMIYD